MPADATFDVNVWTRRGDRRIASAFAAGPGATILFGPSGAGKTTVLDMIAGLRRPDRGHVCVAGRTLFDADRGIDLRPEKRRAGYVFQSSRLFPHMDVRANLLFGAPAGIDPLPAAQTLGIAGLMGRWPRTLSGGEARRVAIARALLSDPAFLLLDEPLASLDRGNREEAMAMIERLRDASGLPMLIVTHDEAEAERLGARVVRM